MPAAHTGRPPAIAATLALDHHTLKGLRTGGMRCREVQAPVAYTTILHTRFFQLCQSILTQQELPLYDKHLQKHLQPTTKRAKVRRAQRPPTTPQPATPQPTPQPAAPSSQPIFLGGADTSVPPKTAVKAGHVLQRLCPFLT